MAKNIVKYSENIGDTAKQQATNIFNDRIKKGDYSMLLPIIGLPIKAQDGFASLVSGGTIADDALYNSFNNEYIFTDEYEILLSLLLLINDLYV